MIQQVLKTIKHYKMFEPGEKVVVAVSGGPDSVALLHLLNQLNIQLCLKLYVAHLDHNLRKGSSRDFIFVEKLARSLKIPFYGRVLDQRKLKKKGSMEDCLRRLRYDFLFDVCQKTKAKKICLGHTKDDQAETVLMRIIRGSGLYGLSAIIPKRTIGTYDIVRPLIEVSRRDILNFLKQNKIPYRSDPTNQKNYFLRNKVRGHLLPLLEKEYNPNIRQVLSNVALTVGADYDYLDSKAQDFLRNNLKHTMKGYSINLVPLKKLDMSLRRLVLRLTIELLQGDLRRISFRHWQEAEELIYLRPQAAQVHLPFNITISKNKGCLHILKR